MFKLEFPLTGIYLFVRNFDILGRMKSFTASRASNNPFDGEESFLPSTSLLRPPPELISPHEVNPFDALMPIEKVGFSTATTTSTSSFRRTERADSKESGGGSDSNSSDDEDDEDDNIYSPDNFFGDDVTGRNRALVFMETPVPAMVECKLLVLEDGMKFEWIHVPTSRCWMRAQKRTDGLKRLTTNVSLWVSPVLLVANHKKKGEEDDANVSFFDVMRELEAADVLQSEVKRDTMLRIGKLRGTPRSRRFNLWGPGKSIKRASGAMDARPEFFVMNFEHGGATLVLQGKNLPKSRPTKKRDMLLSRAKRNDSTVRKLHGSKGGNVWQFHDEGGELIPTIRLSKNSGGGGTGKLDELICEFKDISPAVAFGLAIVISIKNAAALASGQSWSSLLPRRNSMRRASLNGEMFFGS